MDSLYIFRWLAEYHPISSLEPKKKKKSVLLKLLPLPGLACSYRDLQVLMGKRRIFLLKGEEAAPDSLIVSFSNFTA